MLQLIDSDKLEEAKTCVDALVERLGAYNRRTLDQLQARVFFYYFFVHEKLNKLADIHEKLHACLRTATLRHDEDGQATLINCLIRSYLLVNRFDFAEKFISKVSFPEAANNNEWARYMYYLGYVKAITLDYSAAQKNLLQALRKAPQITANGFKQSVQKLLVVVELLLGEIPERSLFRQPLYRKCLYPYLLLTQAVRCGDVHRFNDSLQQNGDRFKADGTHSLCVRLRQNVIRTAVKQISLAYSRISLEDIQKKLQLNSADDAEYIVAKAIADGTIVAQLNHEKRFMESRETADVYATTEPQHQFHSRISFCLEVHNQCVKAMRFPPKSYQDELQSAEERREREQQDLDFAKEMAEEEDDDEDFA